MGCGGVKGGYICYSGGWLGDKKRMVTKIEGKKERWIRNDLLCIYNVRVIYSFF